MKTFFPLLAAALFCLTMARAPAAPRLTAAEAAPRLGQDVVFEDVVKAISQSRTKKGCYFSFGAPYPKQVLSVWVPDEVWDKLPRDPGLIGRTVRIRGRLEASPTGPLLTLASPDQFTLVDADDRMLAKDFLDGRMDREHFMAAVAQAFWREDYDTLEELVRELQESHERFADGTWIEGGFFKGLQIAVSESDQRFADAGARFDRWRAHYHSSAAALIAQAGYHLDLGWHLRATRPADRVLQTQEEFAREASLARHLLEGNPGAKNVLEWFAKMERVAFAQSWPHDAFFRLFAEASAREPDYFDIYFQAAHYLRAKEGRGAWERFAEQQRATRGAGGEGDVLYTRIAWSVSVNYHNLFESTQASWPTMASGFTQLMAQHPDSRWLQNAYARFAFLAHDRARLRPALAAIADHPDMGIWVNLENVALARKFAAEEAVGTHSP